MIEQNFMYFHEILLYHNYTTLYHKISFQAVMSGMPLFCSVVQGLEFLRMVGILRSCGV